MEEQTDYAKREEEKHRRKIILPCVIPWEYGSNKYASQKGSGGFGGQRDATLKIFCTTPFLKPNESVLPRFAIPNADQASQAGSAPMGKFREQVMLVKDQHADEKVEINALVPDSHRMRDRELKRWDKPVDAARSGEQFGKKREVITQSTGGRRFTAEEQQKSRAAIPRFRDPRNTVAALAARPGEALVTGLTRNRQATTEIEGLDRTIQDQLDSNRYMAWLGGQVTLQSQSMTGGFQKPRDVASMNYYDKLIREREADPRGLRTRRRKKVEKPEEKEPERAEEKEEQKEEVENEELEEEEEE